MATMRIGGLASGMDIDTIVGDLMKAERIPLDKLFQQKQTFEWQRDSYRDINKKFADFDKYLFDNFAISSNFNKKTMTTTNDAALSVKATGSSYDSTNSISISQLATAATGVSGNVGGTSTTTLGSLGLTADTTITISSLQADGTYKDEDIIFKTTDKISDVVNKLNQSGLNINAIFDGQSGKLGISTRGTGTVDVVDGTGEVTTDKSEVYVKSATGEDIFTSIFGFATGNDASGIGGVTSLANGGENAKFTLNGMDMERQSNKFTINGIEYTLKAITTNPVTITSTTDVDGMIGKIEEFVNKYNELIGSLNDTIKEKRYRDYPPLTEEQKKDMSEKEIELWEEKAKSGLLRSDSIISSGLSEMRRDLYSRVDGIGENVIDMLSEFGITTSKDITENGKLVIDKDKLRAALESSPDKVVQTISQQGTLTRDASGQVTSDTRGIVQRLRNAMSDMTKNIEEKAGKSTLTNNQFSLGRQLDDVEDRITDFQRRLQDIESRYWRQFTAMEQAIQKANQQSGFLMQQFGG